VDERVQEKTSVPAVSRLLDMFEAFRAIGRPMSLTTLARHMGIPKSSCHGLVSVLVARGYLYYLSRPQMIYPTRKMLDVLADIAVRDPFIARAKELLERLRDLSGETVILGKRQGDGIVYLRVFESTQAIRYTAQPGDLKPLHSTSIGKALLGSLRQSELVTACDRLDLAQITDATCASADQLLDNIREGRRRGYHITRGENVADVWAVAAALHSSEDWLGIAIAGPRHRMEADIQRFGNLVLSTSHLVSRTLEF